MQENPIYLLRFMKKIKTSIDGHYILKIKNNFLVFTSKPVPNIKCTLVSSEKNIVGNQKPQWIAEKIHKFDPLLHKISQPQQICYQGLRTELQPFEFKLLQEHYMQISSEFIAQIQQ